MLNIEKFKNELIELGVINIMNLAKTNNKLASCVWVGCSECDFSTHECGEQTKEWLFSECEEPEVDENNGWIPCSERLPEDGVPVNITWKNNNPPSYYNNIKNIPFTDTAILCKNKWYWYSCICLDILNEFGKNDADAVDKDIDVIAWQPLPEPYREESED